MPITPDDDPRLQKLDAELKAARAEFEEDYNPKPIANSHSQGSSIGYEFLAYVISGGLIGYFLDKYLGIAPFGFMTFIIGGFVAGVLRANARTKQSNAPKEK